MRIIPYFTHYEFFEGRIAYVNCRDHPEDF